ncbi:MAG TPA: hypothetical protein VHI10_04420 [Mycobacterium sp.]|nr:hypothetical protein [Mycobacterium sp.]
MPATKPGVTPLRRLRQKRSAVALAAWLILVPAVPSMIAKLTATDNGDPVVTTGPLSVFTDDGHEVVLDPPLGWSSLEIGNGQVLRSDNGAVITVQAYDLEEREADAVVQRLIRQNRIGGESIAVTGGTVGSASGDLTGPRCAIIVDDGLSGSCAFLSDDDVMLLVTAMSSPDATAPDIADVVGPIHRGDS